MILNGLLDSLRFNADIPLRGGGAAVLQQSLDKYDVIAIVLVNFGGIPLAKAVGTDTVKAQVIADDVQLLLNRARSDGEDDLCPSDAVAQAVILNVLVKHQRDSEDPVLSCFLLHNLQAVTITIPHNIT